MANNNGGGVHDDYLNAPDTAGRPMALMSLILVFLVIAAVALALFVGGRWVYNQYVKDDGSSQVATEQEMNQEVGTEEQASGEGTGNDSSQSTDSSNTGDQSTSNQDGTSGEGSGASNTTDSSGGQSTTSSETESSNSSSGSSTTAESSDEASNEQEAVASAVTGPTATEEVPNTGPESLLAVFTGVTILSAILHRKWLINKL